MKATLQAGLRHTSKFEVSRDRTIVATTEKRLAGKAAKAGLA
jgi:hypothetical protein